MLMMNRLLRALCWVTLAALCASCDDDGSSTMGPSGPSGTETVTFTGATRAIDATSCTGDVHQFTAGNGTIRVTLVSTSPAQSLTVEICEPGILNKPEGCTIGRTPITVGQTLEAPRRGAAQQALSLLPLSCGGGGTPSTDTIAYTATVTFPR